MEVNSKNYARLAQMTSPCEREHFDDQMSRLDEEGLALVAGAVSQIIHVGRLVDFIKRRVFYGQEIDRSDLRFTELMELGQENMPEMVGMQKKLTPVHLRVLHGMFGIQTEAGEIGEAIDWTFMFDQPLDCTNLEEEIGDVLWYVAELCNVLRVEVDEVMYKNIAKLQSGRFAGKFTKEEALNRDLEVERRILESPDFDEDVLPGEDN